VKKTRFSEEQIIAVLREQEAGMKTADVCKARDRAARRCMRGRPNAAVWTSQARKLKVLEERERRLKRLLADAMLDNAVLKEVAAKNW
jgi:putative transposase